MKTEKEILNKIKSLHEEADLLKEVHTSESKIRRLITLMARVEALMWVLYGKDFE